MENKKGLSNTTIVLMVGVAIFFDILQTIFQIIPILGQIISSGIGLFAFLTFYVWFKIKGLNFAKPKRAALLGGGFIIEMIPILNVLPAWTLAVVLLALDSKIKEVVNGTVVGALVNQKDKTPLKTPIPQTLKTNDTRQEKPKRSI